MTNLSTDQPINPGKTSNQPKRLTGHQTNQLTNQSTHQQQQTNRPTNQLTDQPINPPPTTNQPTIRSTSNDQPTNQPTKSTDQSDTVRGQHFGARKLARGRSARHLRVQLLRNEGKCSWAILLRVANISIFYCYRYCCCFCCCLSGLP